MRDIHLVIEHRTRYRYGAPVELAHHLAFLRPLEDAWQRLDAFALEVDPAPPHVTLEHDAFGNARAAFTLTARHEALEVAARSRVVVRPRSPGLEPARSPAWDAVRERLRYAARGDYRAEARFTVPSPYVPRLPALADYAAPSFAPGRPIAEAAVELMHRMHADFRYQPEATDVHTPVAEAFARRAGVCQDFSHVMLGALRGLGLAAQYVSGYLVTLPPEAAAATGAAPLVGADASHAWVALWCPDTPGLPGGWLELDPTNDCLPSLAAVRHARLAVGRDYGDVTPLRGVIRGGGRHTLEVQVRTIEVPEERPVTC